MKRAAVSLILILIVLFVGTRLWQYATRPEPRVVTPHAETLRETASGRVVGFVEDNGTHAWRGIPFAEPPLGKLRWKAPLPPAPWAGTREALEIGSVCPQIGGPLGGVPESEFGAAIGSEDCLFLNISAPAFAPDGVPSGDDLLPVMVWIHGGGNSIGHGGSYNGKLLAERHDLVVVTINYRLGPLGWFSHPALRGAGTTPEDRSGNYGTLDVIRSLAWVRDNIVSFGGDPDNVTVFGESAGARNTVTMLHSPAAKGLFHRAIVQSGGSRTIPRTRAEGYRDAPDPGHPSSSREIVNRLLIADGIVPDREAAKVHQDGMSGDEIAAYLRGRDAGELLASYGSRSAGMLSVPQLFRDGAVLPAEDPLDVFRDPERYNPVPVILGSNRDEHKLFMVQDPEYVKTYLGFYMRLRDRELYELVSAYRTDYRKSTGVDEIARVLRESQGPTVYAYRFDWDEEPSVLGMDLSVFLGAAHGLEIPFVFGDFESSFLGSYIGSEENSAGMRALSAAMSSYWAEFAHSGSPGLGRDGAAPEWEPWENSPTDGAKFIIFDTPTDGGIRMASSSVRLGDLYDRLLAEAGLASQQKHCELYVNLFEYSALWDDRDYANLGREGCSSYPKESYAR
jgi:para-nitrobenzyl esterase